MTLTPTHTISALTLAAALVAAPLAASAASGAYHDGAMGPHYKGAACSHQNAARDGSGWGHWGRHGLRGLDLSQDQQDQIFKIHHDQAQAFYDQRKALRAAAQNLRELGQADSFDEAQARQAADALGQAQAQLALLRAQTKAQIRAVLTSEQRQQLAERHSKRHAVQSANS